MKVRLIMESRKHPGHIALIDTVNPIYPVVWPDDEAIPEGWEELEIVSMLDEEPVGNPCTTLCCNGHSQADHQRGKGECMVPHCKCLKFREAR